LKNKCINFLIFFSFIINLFFSFEKEYQKLIPDLDENQRKTIENFRNIVDKGARFNEGLYEFNEALFNKDEAHAQRQKTHKVLFHN